MTSTSPYSTSPGSAGQVNYSPARTSLAMSNNTATTATGATKPKNKPRKRVNTAEKRNQHNAIERQRRETLNGKFFSLARLLPALATHRRPSKSAIVNNSISHLNHQRNQRLLAAGLLRQLCAERDALAKECNEWRFANGMASTTSTSAWTEEMEQVCDVEKETFGTFANVDNENENYNDNDNADEEDGDDDDTSGEMSLEQASAVAASFNVNAHMNGHGHSHNQGFITPRSSTDAGLGLGNIGMQQWIQHTDGNSNSLFSQLQQQQQQHLPIPSSMQSSTTSLPFNAFMSDSESPANSASGFSNTMPTPPTTGDYQSQSQSHGQGLSFNNQAQHIQHTPSPRSSHSQQGGQVEENRGSGPTSHAWTEQQLLFLRAIQQQQQQQQAQQQQQQQQQQQRMQMPRSQPQQQQQQAPFDPVILANAFQHYQHNGSNPGANANGNGSMSDISDAFNFLNLPLPLMQQSVHLNNNGLSLTGNGNALHMQQGDSTIPAPTQGSAPAPPPLLRAHTEHLEAWRRGTMVPPSAIDLKNAFRAGIGMGMSWDQASRPTVEGF